MLQNERKFLSWVQRNFADNVEQYELDRMITYLAMPAGQPG